MANLVYQKQTNIVIKRARLGIFLAFLIIVTSILLFLYPFASREKVNYFKGENPILYNGKQEGNALIDNNKIYIPFTFLNKQIDETVIFDKKSNSIIVTTKNKVIQMPTDSLTYYINQEPVQIQHSAVKSQNGELYLAIDLIIPYYNIQYSILPNTNAIQIDRDGMKEKYGVINGEDVNEEKLRLRMEKSVYSPYTAQTINREKIMIEKANGDFYYIRKMDGTAGYLNKKFITKGQTKIIQIQKREPDLVVQQMEGPINLTWEAVYSKNPDLAAIPVMPGVNVVSPTWFELSGTNGTLKNLGSLEYGNWAKSRGYQVWGLFSNAFDPDLTHNALQDYETRNNIIQQLLNYSQTYQLNGINIDIENVREEDGPFVTQFMREATPYFHQAGLTVSMNITFITSGNYSAFYEREKLAEIVDYLVVMAYDEHWGTSQEAGSVASLPWVEDNLQTLLKEVQNNKLILGVPLYTRLWEEKETGEVSSKALKMAEVKEWLAGNGITPIYDQASGQNYAEYYASDTRSTYKIWLEDELSLKKRAEMAVKYDLKGVASWSRYFADDTAWLSLMLENTQVTQK